MTTVINNTIRGGDYSIEPIAIATNRYTHVVCWRGLVIAELTADDFAEIKDIVETHDVMPISDIMSYVSEIVPDVRYDELIDAYVNDDIAREAEQEYIDELEHRKSECTYRHRL